MKEPVVKTNIHPFMRQAPDVVYVITANAERGEILKRLITLRGFDRIHCYTHDSVLTFLEKEPPVLAIIDMEGDDEGLLQLLGHFPFQIKSLILSEQFDEALFNFCTAAGARDFLVKPIPDVYLVSRVLQALQENRRMQLAQQKEQILQEMDILSPVSQVFTTSYLLKLLYHQTKQLSEKKANGQEEETFSILLIQLEGYPNDCPESFRHGLLSEVGALIRESTRGEDCVGEYFIDKFMVILPHTGRRGAKALSNRLVDRLHGRVFQLEGDSVISLEIRVGLAEYTDCQHYEDLLEHVVRDLKKSDLKKSVGSILPLHPV